MGRKTTINGYELKDVTTYENIKLMRQGKIELESGYTIYIQLKHTAKMRGIVSISTSPIDNLFCRQHQGLKDCICNHCFSVATSLRYSDHERLMIKNGEALKTTDLTPKDLYLINVLLSPYKYVRIEAFGDIENKTQLKNYMKIIKTCNGCYFGFWTKNYKLMLDYVKQYGIADNVTIVLSNYHMNNVLGDNIYSTFNKYIPSNQLKTFNVYEDPKEKQNCFKSCMNCLKCYSKNDIATIIEKLK